MRYYADPKCDTYSIKYLDVFIMKNTQNSAKVRAGFSKRLAAMVYDTLVVTAIAILSAMLMSGILVLLMDTGILPMGAAQHPSEAIQESGLYTGTIQIWSLLWVVFFFLWFWKNGGQTLGMRAWRLRLFSSNEKPVTWTRLLSRAISSLLGLGTLWLLVNRKQKLALQDKVSSIEMLELTKHDNDHKNW